MNHVVLSGGLDSTCALAVTMEARGSWEVEEPHPVRALSFDYGQRHLKELEAAARVADFYGVDHRIVDIRGLLSGSALIGEVEVPHGHYAEETMRATVVNGRNLLFASVAVAQAAPGDAVIFGVHAGDHPIYPDCRPEFWHAVGEAVGRAYDVAVETPFITLQKSELLGVGIGAGAPVSMTWSCYEGGDLHCGRCGTCVERAEAFALAGAVDPTTYVDPAFWHVATRSTGPVYFDAEPASTSDTA